MPIGAAMIHPHTELRLVDPAIGYGVVATRLIPRGTIAWVRDELDQRLSTDRVRAMPAPLRRLVARYCYVDRHGEFVLCWDHARFVNHSCAPTLRAAGYDFEVAVRDIQPGEELTDDYGTLNLQYDFACACRVPACRATITPSDIDVYAAAWDALVAGPIRCIGSVEQPLWELVREKAEVEAALRGTAPIASIRAHRSPVPIPADLIDAAR